MSDNHGMSRFARMLTACASPLALLATGSAALIAGPAQAQEQTVSDVVVVTSRYREESVQTTPLAITAMSAADLEEKSIENVEDIGQFVPNAFFRENVGNYGPTSTIGLRGVNQQDFSYAFEPAVGLYVDNVYHGTLTGSDMDLLDLQRIEVLRGPQGTLFGKNSLGGAIRLITRKPEGEGAGLIQGAVGDYDLYELRGSYDFTLVPDRIFARVSALGKTRDGYGSSLDFACQMAANGTPGLAGSLTPDPNAGDDCELYSLGGSKTGAVRAQIRILATPRFEINLTADYSNKRQEPLPQTLLTMHGGLFDTGYDVGVINPTFGVRYTLDDRFVTGDPYTNYSSYADPLTGQWYNPHARTEAMGFSSDFDWEMSDNINATIVAAYQKYDSRWSSDTDFTPFPVQGTYQLQEHEQVQLEARLAGTAFEDKLEWAAGAFFYDSNSRAYNTTEFGAFDYSGLLLNFIADDYYYTRNKSTFLHLIYDITDRFSISGGLRFTEEKKSNIFDHQPGLAATSASFGESRWDWKISADYSPTDWVFLYAQVATGFRSAGFTPRIFTVGQLQGIPSEEVLSYEVGAKFNLYEGRVFLNTAAFTSEYDPRLIQVGGVNQCDAPSNPSPTPYFLQGGTCPAGTALAGTTGLPWFYYSNSPGKLNGAEAELTAEPIDRLNVNFTLGYVEYKNDQDDPTATDYRDPSALLVPEWSLSAGVQYAFELFGDADQTLTPRLDWTYQSHRTSGAVNQPNTCPEECVPGYDLFNARLTYDNADKDFTLAAQVTNLFDDFYWQQLGAAVTATGGVPTARTGVPGEPRMFKLIATKRF